jgi:hypothetical protein
MSSVVPNMLPAPVMVLNNEKSWLKFQSQFKIFSLSHPNISMRQLITYESLALVELLLEQASLTQSSKFDIKKIDDDQFIAILDAHYAPKTTVEFVGRLRKITFNGKVTRNDIAKFASSFTHCFESVDTKLQPKSTVIYKMYIEHLTIAPLQEELSLLSVSSLKDLVLHTFDWLDRAEKSGLLNVIPSRAFKKLEPLDHDANEVKKSISSPQIEKGWVDRLRPRANRDSTESSNRSGRFDSNSSRSTNRDPRASDAWRNHSNRGDTKPSTSNATARIVRTAHVNPPVGPTPTIESTVNLAGFSHQYSLIPTHSVSTTRPQRDYSRFHNWSSPTLAPTDNSSNLKPAVVSKYKPDKEEHNKNTSHHQRQRSRSSRHLETRTQRYARRHVTLHSTPVGQPRTDTVHQNRKSTSRSNQLNPDTSRVIRTAPPVNIAAPVPPVNIAAPVPVSTTALVPNTTLITPTVRTEPTAQDSIVSKATKPAPSTFRVATTKVNTTRPAPPTPVNTIPTAPTLNIQTKNGSTSTSMNSKISAIQPLGNAVTNITDRCKTSSRRPPSRNKISNSWDPGPPSCTLRRVPL